MKKKKTFLFVFRTYLVEFFYQELYLLFCSHHKDISSDISAARKNKSTYTHTFDLHPFASFGCRPCHPFRIEILPFLKHLARSTIFPSFIFIVVIHQNYRFVMKYFRLSNENCRKHSFISHQSHSISNIYLRDTYESDDEQKFQNIA